MTLTLRIILLLVAVITAIWILMRIRKSKVKMEDAIFWIVLAVVLFIFATFKEVAYWLSGILGIQTPANCIFLVVIALLLEKVFTLSIELSQLKDKFEVLAAELALRSHDIQSENEEKCSEKGITDIDNV